MYRPAGSANVHTAGALERFRSDPVPIDIVYMVLEYISGDKISLISCSLVCHDWLPPSRRHLFRSMTIDSTAIEGHPHTTRSLSVSTLSSTSFTPR
ncbi:hypothetical protein C8Q79DRAFT_973402 [Trametes meyenii]|nr:hypothetical protein C8Q79DRAFT_973402 [Trametes meyenii]